MYIYLKNIFFASYTQKENQIRDRNIRINTKISKNIFL